MSCVPLWPVGNFLICNKKVELPTYCYRNTSLWIPRLLARGGDGVKAHKAVEAGCGPAQHSTHTKGEEAAAAFVRATAGAFLLATAGATIQAPVGEVRLGQSGYNNECHDAKVEQGEDVVEPRGLLHTNAQHQGQNQGNRECSPV